MQNWNRFPRAILALFLLIIICAGMFAPRVEAKPLGASLRDVIISEVAWGGTAANANHEWIELYNTTSLPIDLSTWKIVVDDGTPETITIPSGFIPSNGYFLLERAEAAVNNITADYVYGNINLNNTTNIPILSLVDNNGVSIDTANSGCTNCWYAGSASPNYYSMERVGVVADGPSAWVSNNVANRNGLDAFGNPINGTPHNSKLDLFITMLVDNPTPIVGNNIEFTVTVTNQGDYDATNVSVMDAFPTAGLTFQSAVPSLGTYSIGTGIWTIGTLDRRASETLRLTGTITAEGVKTNSAEIWTVDQFDPDSAPGNGITTEDDYAFAKATTPGALSLNITNVVNNPTPNVGSNVVFTITVSNPSTNPYLATAVNVAAALPATGLTYVSSSATVGTYSTGTGNWSVGSLTMGTSATLSVTAKVTSGVTKNYSATVSSVEYLPSTATATVTPVASTQADLSLTQTWARSATALGVADLTITVLNVSDNDANTVNTATGVQVRALLPSGLTYVSHTTVPAGTNYNSSTGIWAVGTVNEGGNAVLTISVRPAASGTSTTSFAEVWLSDQFDPTSTPGNGNTGEDDSNLSNIVDVQVADLSLTQKVDIAGSNAVFTLVVTNAGPDNASGVHVKNSRLFVPASYIYVSSSTVNYNSATGDWNIGALASGASATLTVTTTIVSLDENLAEVSAVNEVDPDSLYNNGSRTEDDDASAPSADLSLTNTIISPSPYNNSDISATVKFRVTLTNAGYANATNVEVRDLLPSGLSHVQSGITLPSGTTYNKTSGIWAIPAIARNTSLSLDITARVDSYGIKTNLAEVWKSDQSDPDSLPGNSSTTEDDYASVQVTSYRSVIINEIAWSGTAASAEDEWIELFNPSNAEITITGWKIRKNSCSLAGGSDYISLSGKIASNGYFLLERGDTASDNSTVLDVAASQIYLTSTPKLLDTGETLYLCDNFGKFIDNANQQGAGSSSNPWPQGGLSPNYPSMERISNATEEDASWRSNNGVIKNGKNANGGLIYGTPGKRNSTGSTSAATAIPITPTPSPVPFIPPDPRPIINEILPRPGFDWNQDGKVNVFDEFIEIKNLTSIDITLNGWRLDTVSGASFSLPDVTLKPDQRIVFYSLETNLLLSDGGETVRLINSSGKIYDAYTYTIARAEDKSICRLPDGNVYNGWFEDCIPTPNLSNTREGTVPVMPGEGYQSPVCQLPDTLPADFLFAECRGYGANIWNADYWDQPDNSSLHYIPQNTSKWEAIIE